MVISTGKSFHIQIVDRKKMIDKLHSYIEDAHSDIGTLLYGW